ncbi:MAG: hypothetical protein D6805_08220 [Planctomycetota bacterium]|nr:MAG: hypothetical protein D6805_08220 [Planctomycetota bacterium]
MDIDGNFYMVGLLFLWNRYFGWIFFFGLFLAIIFSFSKNCASFFQTKGIKCFLFPKLEK